MVVSPNNMDTVNNILVMLLGSFNDMEWKIKRCLDLHSIAESSPLGWKDVSAIEEKETKFETMSQLDVRSYERSLMSHQEALDKAAQFATKKLFFPRWNNRTKKRKQPASKSETSHIPKAPGGGITKPRHGGCHRCGGPHFVRNSPKPLAL